jgi:hypothetical protein
MQKLVHGLVDACVAYMAVDYCGNKILLWYLRRAMQRQQGRTGAD